MHKDHVQEYLLKVTKHLFGPINPEYDPSTDIIPQPIYRRHEIPIADYLMSFKEALTEEFLRGYSNLEKAINAQGRPVLQKREDRKQYFDKVEFDAQLTRFPDAATQFIRTLRGDESIVNPHAWKNVELKYHCPFENIHWDIDPEYAQKRYPVAYKLIQEFGDDCPISSFSYIGPMSTLHRHTGPENRLGEFIRIHIPLIIPPGDIFFEVHGEEIDWSDIFAFDNQLAHSAHNLSNDHRLIFLIDIRRSRIGMPPGQTYNRDRQLHSVATPFVRKPKNER